MAMIAMTTRSSMRVKPRERMVRGCGLPVGNGSLKRACDETSCAPLQSLKRPPPPCQPIPYEAGRDLVILLAVFFRRDRPFSCGRYV